MPGTLHPSDSRMIGLVSRARTALGADALCFWRVDASGAAMPVLCTPEGWPTAAFAPPAAEEPAIVLASGEAAATLLPEELRLSRNVAPGAVLRASGTTRGLVSLWESGRTPPPDASRTAQALLEQWAVLDHECALSQERDQVRLQMEGLFLAMPQGVIRLPEAQHPGLVNEAAALLLGVPIGEIAEPELAAALTRLIERSEEPMILREGLSAARHSGAPPREFTVQQTPAGVVLADAQGKTIYTYTCGDDAPDQLGCDHPSQTQAYRIGLCGGGSAERCLKNFPYVPAAAKSRSGGPLWSVVAIDPRSGHFAQPGAPEALQVWAFRGRPVYTFAGDPGPGDTNAESLGEFQSERTGYKAFWLRTDVARVEF
jgi:predicted lipoprotein with Yx(FWY)xxD motif